MAWLPFAKLEITDGTAAGTINLLNNQSSGFNVTDWQPAIQDLKAGGTWADPPTADGRELIVSQLANVEDQFTFDVWAATPNELIGYLRALRTLLEKGRQYTTTTWQDTPVYLKAQSYGETNARYTRVKNWRTPADGFPYGPPMWDTIEGTAIEDFQIIIEHGAWLENPPGTGTATEISAVETYDGRNLGNVDDAGTREPTTANEVYVANKRNVANLSDIYVDNGGAWGANLMDAALPFALLPAVPAIADAVYFGIDTTLADSGPFASLVLDIGTAGAGYTGIWEYWNGAWVALTVQDNTAAIIPFDTTGVNSVHWQQPADWATRNIALDGGPAITGYFVRMRVVTIPGALVAPTQQNRDVYSIIWPYIEIQSSQIEGDIVALARMILYGQVGSAFVLPTLSANRVFAGLRSMSRGTSFTAYLNAADEQNATGVTVTAVNANATINATVISHTGKRITYTPLADSPLYGDPIGKWDLTAVASEYRGSFHVFARVGYNGAVAQGDFAFKFGVDLGGSGFADNMQTEPVFPDIGTGIYQLIDLGAISVNPNIDVDDLAFNLYSAPVNGALKSVYLYDIILLPVDEFALQIFSIDSALSINPLLFLDIDSISVPKTSTICGIYTKAASTLVYVVACVASGQALWQANAHQRLWIVQDKIDSDGISDYALSEMAFSAQCYKNQRYWSMRGTG